MLLPADAGPAAVDFAEDLSRRYGLDSLAPLVASCRASLLQSELTVAVVGRFKAGKSSFLNHLIGRPILPAGVVPVTAIVTEIRYGPLERARVHFLDGRSGEVEVESVGRYVSERENPENAKRVKRIAIELPGLRRFCGLVFADTPGLDSALAHNSEQSLRWLPNSGIALVAVSVDPPLSQQDIALIERLYRFTPNVTVLLTKADLIGPEERAEVIAFVEEQLGKAFPTAPRVVPYSIRLGYEDLRNSLEARVFQPVLSRFNQERGTILRRKVNTLLGECGDYVRLSLKSVELADAEREAVKEQLLGQRQNLGDVKAQLRLVVRDLAARARPLAERLFNAYQQPLENQLLLDLAGEFPKWTASLARLLESFDGWLSARLAGELAAASANERQRLMEPLELASRQITRILQDFRDRLSEGTMRAFGVPLRTTEAGIEVSEPEAPDVHAGKIFDRNWELISPLVPVAPLRGIVRRHFERQLSYKLSTNLARLVSQWDERINRALSAMEQGAEHRLEELISTVEHLIDASAGNRRSGILQDLEKIETLRSALAGGQTTDAT